jgi:hypothetical protein
VPSRALVGTSETGQPGRHNLGLASAPATIATKAEHIRDAKRDNDRRRASQPPPPSPSSHPFANYDEAVIDVCFKTYVVTRVTMMKGAEVIARGALLGAFVGDASGATLEFLGRKPNK